jgi:hypothetical protein
MRKTFAAVGVIVVMLVFLKPWYSDEKGVCINFMGEIGTRVCSK